MKINTDTCTNFNQFDDQIDQLCRTNDTELHEQAPNICQFIDQNISYIQVPETAYKLKFLLDKITVDIKPGTAAYQSFSRIVDVVNRTLPTATFVQINSEEIPIAEAVPVSSYLQDSMSLLSKQDPHPEPSAPPFPSAMGGAQIFTQPEPSAPFAPSPAMNLAYEEKPLRNRAEDWSKIKKEQIEKLNPKWYEKEKTRSLATKFFAGFSVMFAGMAYGTGFLFTANPYTILGTTAFFVACSAGSAVGAFFSRTGGKQFSKDPEVLVRKGKEAEADIIDSTEPKLYQYIAKKYDVLLKNNVLTNEHLNRLFHTRIASNLPYENLRELLKSPNSSSFEFGFPLSLENRDLLKAKALDPSWGKEELMSEQEIQTLGISPDLIAKKVTDKTFFQLLRNEISYSTFAKAVSVHWNRFDSDQLQQIKPLAIAYYIQSHQGVKKVLDDIRKTGMDIGLVDLIQHGVLSYDINEVISGRLSYIDFREKHSIEAIQQHQLHSNNQIEKEAIKTAYLRYYRTMHDFKGDAKVLGINDIEAKLQSKFQEELQQIHSLDEIGERLGYSVFTENLLTKHTPFLRKLVLQQLKRDSYIVSSSSILKICDLLSGDIQQKIQVALEEDTKVTEAYQYKIKQADYEFIGLKAQYTDTLAAKKRAELDPIIKDLNHIRADLSHFTERAAACQAKIAEYEIEEIKRNKNRESLHLAKQSLEMIKAKEKSIGVSQPGRVGSLRKELEELKRKSLRKEKVSSLLIDMDKIPEIRAKIEDHKIKIEEIQQKLSENQQVKGINNAFAAIQQESKLKAEKTKLEEKKKELQSKLDAAQLLTHQKGSLQQELAELSSVDAKLTEVSRNLKQAEEQDKLAAEKKKWENEIYSFEKLLGNQILEQVFETGNRFNLETQLMGFNNNIATLKARESQYEQSVTVTKTRLETEYNVALKFAEDATKREKDRLTVIKNDQLIKIRKQFQEELATLT